MPHAPRSPEPPQLMKSLLDDRLQDSEVHDEVIFTSCANDPVPNKTVSASQVQSHDKVHSIGLPTTKSLGTSILMRHFSPEKKTLTGSVSNDSACTTYSMCLREREGERAGKDRE